MSEQSIAPAPAKRSGTNITFLVGANKDRVRIPKEILANRSTYFSAKFTEESQAALTIELPRFELEIVKFMKEWVETGKIQEQLCHNWAIDYEARLAADRPTQLQLVKLWMLGDAFLMYELQNKALGMLERLIRVRRRTSLEAANYVFNNLRRNNALYQYMIHKVCFGRMPEIDSEWERHSKDIPQDALLRIADVLRLSHALCWNQHHVHFSNWSTFSVPEHRWYSDLDPNPQ